MTGSGSGPELPHPLLGADLAPAPDVPPAAAEAGPAAAEAGPAAAEAGPAAGAFGLFRFTIEGREAPGLFVAGWVATLLGGSAAFVGLLAGPTVAGAILFVVGLAVIFVALILLGGSQAVERRHAGLAYAGPAPILVFTAVVAGWYLAAVVVGTPLQLIGIEPSGPALSLLGVGLQAIVVLGLLRLMVIGPGAMTWRAMGLTRPDAAALRQFTWGAVFAAPVVVITAVVLIGLIAALGQQPASPLPPAGTSSGLILNLIAGAVIAPFYEELFFRGFTLTAWRRMTGPGRAIIRSAILFAAIHAIDQTGDTFSSAVGVAVVAAAARLPVALVLGWVYDRRGSIWASIGLHAAFNAILLLIAERSLAG